MSIIFTGIAGVTIATGKGIAFDTATAKYKLFHNVTTPVRFGIALTDAVADGQVQYLFNGVASVPAPGSGVTIGDTISISAADSTLTTGAGTSIGTALSTAASGEDFILFIGSSTGGAGDVDYLFQANTSSSAIASTASETDFDVQYTMPADTIPDNTVSIFIRASGKLSTTGNPNIRIRIKVGASTVFDSDPVLTFTNSTDVGWTVETEFKCRTSGASGSMMRDSGFAAVGKQGSATSSSVTGTFTLDTTATALIKVTGEWSASSASNTITMEGFKVATIGTSGTGGSGGGGSTTAHNLLDGSIHPDTAAGTVVRGDTIVGNSTPKWARLPKGTSGQVLTMLDANDPGWATPTSTPGIQLFDPTLGTWLFDDFIANVQLTSQITSSLGWDKLLGSGTIQNGNSQDNVSSAPPNSEFHPGVIRLQTAGSASGRAAISLGGTVNAGASGMFTCSGGILVCEWLFQMYDLSSATHRFKIQLGMGNNWASNAIPWDAGFWIEYTDNVNSGKFEYKRLGSGETNTVDSGVTAAADTWYKVKFVTNADWSEITYTINGASSQAINGTNDLVNTDSVSPGAVIIKSVGTTSRELIIDYFRLYQTFSTARQ